MKRPISRNLIINSNSRQRLNLFPVFSRIPFLSFFVFFSLLLVLLLLFCLLLLLFICYFCCRCWCFTIVILIYDDEGIMMIVMVIVMIRMMILMMLIVNIMAIDIIIILMTFLIIIKYHLSSTDIPRKKNTYVYIFSLQFNSYSQCLPTFLLLLYGKEEKKTSDYIFHLTFIS